VRYPYRDARVWSRKAARLGANDGQLECFVCVSVHDRRWLARLSDSEAAAGNDGSDDDGASGGSRRWTQPRRRRTWTLVPSLRNGPAMARASASTFASVGAAPCLEMRRCGVEARCTTTGAQAWELGMQRLVTSLYDFL
jgi:hypothetical protein